MTAYQPLSYNSRGPASDDLGGKFSASLLASLHVHRLSVWVTAEPELQASS